MIFGSSVYNPDSYRLKAELTGFLPQQVDAVVVGLAKTVTVDLSLKVGGVTETVDVRAEASTVDVKSAATDTNLSNDLLTLIPIYSSTSATLMNYAPGINDQSAYGAQGPYGNALLLDGVDTRDPEGGSAWTFFNQNLIQEVQIERAGRPGGIRRFYRRDHEHRDEVRGQRVLRDSSPFAIRAIRSHPTTSAAASLPQTRRLVRRRSRRA